jgi:hypothetical protein
MTGEKYPGAIIVSTDGTLAVKLTEFEGIYPIPGRDASGAYFGVQVKPAARPTRLAVLFSGLSQGADWTWYGLPVIHEADRRLVYFAEAAIGEELDRNGLPAATPSGVDAFKIECFSNTLQEWRNRDRAADEQIYNYIAAKLFWTWRFEDRRAVFRHPDFLRVRATVEVFERVSLLGEGADWRQIEITGDSLVLEPTPEFLRKRQRKAGLAPVTAVDAVLSTLVAQGEPELPINLRFQDGGRDYELRVWRESSRVIVQCFRDGKPASPRFGVDDYTGADYRMYGGHDPVRELIRIAVGDVIRHETSPDL